eukprot:CAMPEP_0194495052 /NCGR_PEP_ID=MMETSP0253-20130528/12775_1 /TAXON_ID=2966 /ORGANISM="Noctiluca scintillans" /LENGTH=66 /DNA_ID=CAMNT_0039336247 /DNA_START=81 /DNA_END=281 /DNA_ORIENTATION=-
MTSADGLLESSTCLAIILMSPRLSSRCDSASANLADACTSRPYFRAKSSTSLSGVAVPRKVPSRIS